MRGLDGVSYKLQGSVLDARGSHKPEDRGGSGDCNIFNAELRRAAKAPVLHTEKS